MVDSGKRKRSSSVRETAQVKRHSPSPSPTPSNASPAAPDVPTSFDYARPLPTLPELQEPEEWYQSIAESGLMEESLRRSREKWLSEDNPIFEKFWTKPLKKRVFNEKMNPPKESMLKIGECEMLVQPHLFEIRLYGVREPQPPPPQPQQASPPPIHHQQLGAPIPGYYYPPHQYLPHPQYPPPPTQAAPVPQTQPTHPPPHPQTLPPINAPVPPPPAPQCQPAQRPPPPAAYPQLPPPATQRPAYMVPGGPLPHPSLHRPGAPSPYVHQQPVPSPGVPLAQPNGQPQQPNQSAPNGSPPQACVPPTTADARLNGKFPAASPNTAPSQLPTPPSSQQGIVSQPATTQQPPPATAPEPTTTTTTTIMNTAPQQQSGPPPPLSRPDPVIQLLATKAATDPDLKALMRIVAGGNASQEELKIFQQHIDELTPQANAIKARHVEEDRLAVIRWHQEQQERQQHLLLHQQQQQQQLQQQRQQQFAHPQGHPPLGVPQQGQTPMSHLAGPLPQYQYPHPHPYQHHPPPPPVKSRQASAPSVPKIVNYSAIVFEFVQSDHSDRFAFPKNSILEYRDHGCEVLASFLILRTLKNPSGEDVEYYEPVTVYLRSQSAKTLEHLQRMVPHPEVVRTYMTEVMTKRQRAPKSWPVYRLKRLVKSGHGSDSEAESDDESRRASHTPAPVRGTKDTARRRQSSTPGMAEPKASVPMRTGPRVKVIKKPSSSSSSALHRPTATSFTSATQSQSPTATSSIPPSAPPKPSQPPKPKLPRSRKGRIADPTKSCHLCKTSKTSLWRKAELDGEAVTVCNACGIKWKTQTSRQAANAVAVANGEEPRFGEDGKGVVRKKERQVSITGSITGSTAGRGGSGSVEGHLPTYGTFMPPQVGGSYAGAGHPQPQSLTPHLYPENTLPPILSHGQQYPVSASPIPHQTSYPLSQPPPSSARPLGQLIVIAPSVSPPQPSISPLSPPPVSPPSRPSISPLSPPPFSPPFQPE